MRNLSKYIIASLLLVTMYACVKEDFNTNPSASLNFSTDTIFFDTVFTDVGSTTAYLKIHNPYDEYLKINSIGIGMGANSPYRINVNGTSAPLVKNIELAPKDSLYVLVEVTINPNDENSPFVVQDSIVCNVNGSTQDVKLMAWGQNAHYIDGRYNGVIQTTTWTADKPYLIYNAMMIDSLHTLTIEAGTHIYIHKTVKGIKNLKITPLIAKGTLKIKGTPDQPVVIQGDRLEEAYKDAPGQWGNIILADGSGTHEVEWAVIKNGTIGFQIGSVNSTEKPTLKLKNTMIQNMDYAGILSFASTIEAENCLISNSGYYLMALLAGGHYDFKQCTFANYWRHGIRTEPSLIISNNFISQEGQFLGDMEQANFSNCIIYGDNENELTLSEADGVGFNYFFKNTLYKISEDVSLNSTFLESCIENKNPNFMDTRNNDFRLDTLSPAQNKGSVSVAQEAEWDLDNESHLSDGLPDLGAYERKE